MTEQPDRPWPLKPYGPPGPVGPSGGGRGGFGTAQIDDPASLQKAGQGALELAGRLHSDAGHANDDTSYAAIGLKGDFWYGALGNTLDQTLETWSTQTAALVRKCRDLHTKCTATADNYTRTETTNVSNLSALKSQSPFG